MQPPTQEPSQLLFTPLMISMVGIVSTALAILLYHVIMNKYCVRGGATNRHRGISRRFQWNITDKANGLEEKILQTIPIVLYSKEEGGMFGGDEIECAVCLSELKQGDSVRLLPNCHHSFHVHCIDEWFLSHSNCPVCRAPMVADLSSVSIDVESCDAADGQASGNEEDADISEQPNHLRSLSSEINSTASSVVLKRSISVDFSSISLQKEKGSEADTPSSSITPATSSKGGISRSSSYKMRSLRSLERASSVLMKSYSRLWSNDSNSATTTNTTSSEGILPR